jgi:hypothetical protein
MIEGVVGFCIHPVVHSHVCGYGNVNSERERVCLGKTERPGLYGGV